MCKTGIVFDIQRMSVNNGDGLRTSIFLKGCPLRCLWCHNPESVRAKPDLFFKSQKCIACGKCALICGCHRMQEGLHLFEREKCIRCMKCTEVCPAGALEKIGSEMTVDEVMELVMRDKTFFDMSGGGVTITGGEPLFQSEFTTLLAQKCHEQGIHVCIDTCGYAPSEKYEALAQYADTFLFDIKETDPALHKKYTGVDNALILQNLHLLDTSGKTIYLRCPIIPGYNDRPEHLKGIARLANSLTYVHEVNVIPYHPLGEEKLDWMEKGHIITGLSFPEPQNVQMWIDSISAETHCPVTTA